MGHGRSAKSGVIVNSWHPFWEAVWGPLGWSWSNPFSFAQFVSCTCSLLHKQRNRKSSFLFGDRCLNLFLLELFTCYSPNLSQPKKWMILFTCVVEIKDIWWYMYFEIYLNLTFIWTIYIIFSTLSTWRATEGLCVGTCFGYFSA
jgi:hypothetical protein